VDEILQFASQDTGLPIKHKVKRRLTKRDEVQSYIEKSMKDDKDAKRLERSSAVLKKFGLAAAQLRPVHLSGDDAARAGCGILRRQNENGESAELAGRGTAEAGAGARADARAPGPVVRHREMDEGIGGKDDKKDDPSPADIVNDEESSARQAVVEGQAMVVLLDYSLAPDRKDAAGIAADCRSAQAGHAGGDGRFSGVSRCSDFSERGADVPLSLRTRLYRRAPAGGREGTGLRGRLQDPPKTTREIMEPRPI
jgi:hypothetical protein